MSKTINKGYVLVDCGAFIGIYTLLFCKKAGRDGAVFSIEPDTKAFQYLTINSSINNCNNVNLINKAMSDTVGTIGFIKSTDEGVGPAGGITTNDPSSNNLVECINLDYLDIDSLDWLKLDVDGHETQILDGAKELIMRSKDPKLIIEFDPIHFGSDHNENSLIQKLIDLSFNRAIICENRYQIVLLNDIPKICKQRKNLIVFRENHHAK